YPTPSTIAGSISRLELLRWFQEGKRIGKDFVLVDLRRTDFEGGTIRGSLNLPAQSLYPTIPTLYSIISQGRVANVVWYCGSSRGRGVRAANWFAEYLQEQKDTKIRSLVLEGGIKGWAAAGKDYTRLMDEYDELKWRCQGTVTYHIRQVESRGNPHTETLFPAVSCLYYTMSLSSNTSLPPDCGYGWVCVAACFSINCFTWGAVSSYGVYLAHYLSNNIFPEATPMDFALIGGLNFSMAMLVAPAVTIIARKYGTKLPMLLGLGLLASGYVSASFSQRIWQLYLSQGVLIGFGVGFIYIPSIPVLSQWFDKKRSLANGISAAGSGIGGLIFSFMDGSIIQKISLAWALRLTAIISCSILVIAILLIQTRNEAIQPSQRGFDVKLLHRLDVLLLLSWAFLSMLGYICLLFSLPDYARSMGLSNNQATIVNAVLNLGTAVGRPLIGVASDRFGRIEVAGLLTCFCGVTCFVIWLPSASYGVLVLFAFLSGAILGVFWVHSNYAV
ncbi:major facilitator superfamily domain-containing protein, partial [Penicillium sp. CMV-2018d]